MGDQRKRNNGSYQVIVSDRALKDLDKIISHIALINHQPLNAVKVSRGIWETIARIGEHPLVFQECSALPTKAGKYRRAIYSSWQLIYKITRAEIFVLGIVHISQHPSAIKKLRK